MQGIEGLGVQVPDAAPDVRLMLDFLARVSPQRGIVR
jgi:hypothetical protein